MNLPFVRKPFDRWLYVPSVTSSCQSNVKQVSLGILMYTQDNDERLPLAPKWMDAVMPVVKNEQVFKCPSIQISYGYSDTTRFGYGSNSLLSGKTLSEFRKPEQTLLMFDSTNLARNASDPGTSLDFANPRHSMLVEHEGRKEVNVVSRLDGSARVITDRSDLNSQAPLRR